MTADDARRFVNVLQKALDMDNPTADARASPQLMGRSDGLQATTGRRLPQVSAMAVRK